MDQEGELNHNCRVKREVVVRICELLSLPNRKSRQKIADDIGVSFHIVNNIAREKTWTKISSKYGILHEVY